MRLVSSVALIWVACSLPSCAQETDAPQSWAEFVLRGDRRQDEGDLDGSIADYSDAIRLAPELPLPIKRRGQALLRKGDLESAINDLTTVIRLDPKDASARRLRGDARADMGALDAAMADIDEAINLDPDYAAAFISRGSIHEEKGGFNAAILDYNKAISISPNDVLAFNNRASARYLNGDVEGAQADWNEALRLDPKCALALKNLGCVRYDQALFAQALEYAQKSLDVSVNPEDRDYAAILAMLCHLRLGEGDRARPTLHRVFDGRRGDSPKDWPAAIAAFLSGIVSEQDFLQAKETADAWKTRERSCEAWFYAGTVRLVNGDLSTATDYFGKCVSTKMFTFGEYARARAELTRAKGEK